MKGLVPVDNDRRGRPREHPQLPVPVPTSGGSPTFDDVTSGEKAPLGWILCNFRLRMRAPKEPPSGSCDLRSLPVAMVLVLHFVLLPVAHAQNIVPVTSGQGLFWLRD